MCKSWHRRRYGATRSRPRHGWRNQKRRNPGCALHRSGMDTVVSGRRRSCRRNRQLPVARGYDRTRTRNPVPCRRFRRHGGAAQRTVFVRRCNTRQSVSTCRRRRFVMNTLLAFLFGIPLAAELLGGCLSIVDSWNEPNARAAAVERLAIPLLLWGGLWWWVGADASGPLWSALLIVAGWQVVSFYGVELLGRWRRFQTIAVDTDTLAHGGPTQKKSPGDNGDWGGER